MLSLLFVLLVIFGFSWIAGGVLFRSQFLMALGFTLLVLALLLYGYHYAR